VFFEVYAKWINSKNDREEIAKLDQAVAQLSPSCPQTENKPETDEPQGRAQKQKSP
jgi:hypothetical protein